jgi:hypothetical protein
MTFRLQGRKLDSHRGEETQTTHTHTYNHPFVNSWFLTPKCSTTPFEMQLNLGQVFSNKIYKNLVTLKNTSPKSKHPFILIFSNKIYKTRGVWGHGDTLKKYLNKWKHLCCGKAHSILLQGRKLDSHRGEECEKKQNISSKIYLIN